MKLLPQRKNIVFTTNCILRHQNTKTFLLLELRTRTTFVKIHLFFVFFFGGGKFIVSKVFLTKNPLENYAICIFSLDISRLICIKCPKHAISKKHSIIPLPWKTWPNGTEINEILQSNNIPHDLTNHNRLVSYTVSSSWPQKSLAKTNPLTGCDECEMWGRKKQARKRNNNKIFLKEATKYARKFKPNSCKIKFLSWGKSPSKPFLSTNRKSTTKINNNYKNNCFL